MKAFFIIIAITYFTLLRAQPSILNHQSSIINFQSSIQPAAYNTSEYLPILKNKKVAIVGNHTSIINSTHLLDTLIASGIDVKRIFCPEHGFRGNAGAGEKIKNSTDKKTGIKIISLYGKHYKPTPSDLKDIDVVVFDLQDVGVRCFTYISTLHYVMEACAQNGKQLIVLDRPNPNGFYVDGPVLEKKYKSFVGLHAVPLVYGMNIGEYAQMINGERWLKDSVQCNLTVIKCSNYKHSSKYELPIKPSPNLPNMQAVYLYPSLALFEGTCVNVGRGTDFPFQVVGHPQLDTFNIQYTPRSTEAAPFPPHRDTLCNGIDLRTVSISDSGNFTLRYLQFTYNHLPNKTGYFKKFFYNLSGNGILRLQIEQGIPEVEIRKNWKGDIDKFMKIREKYLLYN